MYTILKHTHLVFILLAVVLFVLNFYWLRTKHANAEKAVFKKVLLHTNLTVLLLGAALTGLLQVNPLQEQNYWVLEKLGAFIAYVVMVHVALNEKTRTRMQFMTFIGAFGWVAYIAELAMTKQAILLVG
ncbi:SirB2 family protein [Psychromonas aquimarina]|uniref:SirB2 family protein n=1 Tax=Psychromonas aquimarina TaxID=444919 RepID=UPI000422B682|nr:SirB2 family protein [Psychromonas aquimarina]